MYGRRCIMAAVRCASTWCDVRRHGACSPFLRTSGAGVAAGGGPWITCFLRGCCPFGGCCSACDRAAAARFLMLRRAASSDAPGLPARSHASFTCMPSSTSLTAQSYSGFVLGAI